MDRVPAAACCTTSRTVDFTSSTISFSPTTCSLQRLAFRLDHFGRLETQGQVVAAFPQERVHFPGEDGFALFGEALQCSRDQLGFQRLHGTARTPASWNKERPCGVPEKFLASCARTYSTTSASSGSLSRSALVSSTATLGVYW